MREHTHISYEEITVLILAGGRGSRMGGCDKGLIPILGKPILDHLLARIGLQSQRILISANRNFEHYARYGYPVVRDTVAGFAGPLAGFLAGFSADLAGRCAAAKPRLSGTHDTGPAANWQTSLRR